MKQTRTPAQAVIVRMWCDCGGEFIFDKEMADEESSWLVYREHHTWPHKCNKCGRVERFESGFPYTGFEEMNKKIPGNLMHGENKNG